MELFNTLQDIFRDILNNDNFNISRELIINDIDNWDSLVQISIINACESEFSVRFSLDEIINFHSIGDLIDIINKKKTFK